MVTMIEFKINDTIKNIKNDKIGYINSIFKDNNLSSSNILYGVIYFGNNEYEIINSIDIKHFINKKETI